MVRRRCALALLLPAALACPARVVVSFDVDARAFAIDFDARESLLGTALAFVLAANITHGDGCASALCAATALAEHARRAFLAAPGCDPRGIEDRRLDVLQVGRGLASVLWRATRCLLGRRPRGE